MKDSSVISPAKNTTPPKIDNASLRALRVSESRYRRLFESAQDGILLLNAATAQIEDVNPYLIKMLGYSHSEFLGKKIWEVGSFADIAQSKEMFAELQTKGYVRYDDLPLKTRDGQQIAVEFVSNTYDCEGIKVIQCNIRNMTERHADHVKIQRQTQLYATLSQCNKAIVHCTNQEQLFQEVCRAAVQNGGMAMAWIGLINTETGVVRPTISFGDVTEFLKYVTISIDANSPFGQGPTSRAIREVRPIWCQDFLNFPITLPCKESAARAGFVASASIPLHCEERLVGVFVLYSSEVNSFDQSTRDLLTEMARDISFALDNFVRQSQRQRAETKIAFLNRVYAVLSGINSLIVRVRNREELFEDACRVAVEAGGFRMALIAIVDKSTMKTMPVASAGKDKSLLKDINGILLFDEHSANTMVRRAIGEQTAIVSNDSQNDPSLVFGKRYAEFGVRSIVILPLIVENVSVGVIALCAGEIDFFHAEEMQLLNELAGNVGYAIDHIDKQERLNHLAYYDALTGLANRSLFLDRVTQFIRSTNVDGQKLPIAIIDLERFKSINDSLGWAAGDELLKQVAKWLTQRTGDAALLARLDGDHLAMVFPEVRQKSELVLLVEETLELFNHHAFQVNDAAFKIGIKIGIALSPDDGSDADTLLRNAEAALKKAKASGDRFLFHTLKMTETMANKLTLENQLREAIENEEFVLHYQPKVNLASGKVTSAEALIRWNNPRTGLVPPGQFIPILEETGLIYQVGSWALCKAIEDYCFWCDSGATPLRIAVNVSPLQLRNRSFISEIERNISIDPRAATGLELELTETLVMADVKRSIVRLQAIRAMNITIAIDDFGTGFSSLSYLAKLPVDTLKIDRSFVIDMTVGPEGLALVSTIIQLAHALKLKVVAEGVEVEEQARLLHLLGCDEMQGFLFSKPVPADIFAKRFLTPLCAK